MKVTREYLYYIRLWDAARKHFEAKIIDKNAMYYEFRTANEWYNECK